MLRFTCLVAAAVLLFAVPASTGESQAPEKALSQELLPAPELGTAEAGLCRPDQAPVWTMWPFPIDPSISGCSHSQEQACGTCACLVIRNQPQCFC